MMSTKTVLIVEDDQAIRDMIRSILEIEGYEVRAASNGAEGIQLLQQNGVPSVVILDMMMPKMNGWDFLDVMRSNPKTADIPVVVVSAYGEIAKSVKPTCYVPKPVKLEALLSALESCAA